MELTTAANPTPFVLSQSNFRHLYYSMRQQLVHHTVTGMYLVPISPFLERVNDSLLQDATCNPETCLALAPSQARCVAISIADRYLHFFSLILVVDCLDHVDSCKFQTPDSFGSLLELCWKGTKPIELPNKETRTFIADGDTITMTAWAQVRVYSAGSI